MRKHPTSTADIIGTAKALLAGASANTELLQKFSLDQKALNDLLNRFVQLDTQHEKLKADLHQTSSEQRAVRQSLLAEYARWVSVLEGHLGKNSDKLTAFGIPPRQFRPHKGPRAPVTS